MIPRPSTDFSACATEAALLRAVGQRALPLLFAHIRSRRPVVLARRVLLGVSLRPFVCMDLLGGISASVRLAGHPLPRVVGVLQGSEPLAVPPTWPTHRSAL